MAKAKTVKTETSKGKSLKARRTESGVVLVKLTPKQVEARNRFLTNASLSAVSKKGGTLTRAQAAKYVREYLRSKESDNMEAAS